MSYYAKFHDERIFLNDPRLSEDVVKLAKRWKELNFIIPEKHETPGTIYERKCLVKALLGRGYFIDGYAPYAFLYEAKDEFKQELKKQYAGCEVIV